jgi:hypothetical protein
MKKSLSCKEMGVDTCSFQVLSEKNAEIKDALLTHVGKFHPDKVKNLSKQQQEEMSQMMDAKLTM